jgi:hypothetical protein
MLVALFIQFMIVFILIIAFIWFGIKAFSLGGAFGFLSKTFAPAGIFINLHKLILLAGFLQKKDTSESFKDESIGKVVDDSNSLLQGGS